MYCQRQKNPLQHELEQNETQGVLGLPVLDKTKTTTSKGLYE